MSQDSPTQPGVKQGKKYKSMGRALPLRTAALCTAWIGVPLMHWMKVDAALIGGLLALTGAFLGVDTIRPGGMLSEE